MVKRIRFCKMFNFEFCILIPNEFILPLTFCNILLNPIKNGKEPRYCRVPRKSKNY